MNELENFGQVLLGAINNSVGINENPGNISSTLELGTFASKIEQSEHRKYLEDGMIRNRRPRNFEILSQTPDITVVFKKKYFSSLSENYRFDLMNEEEKLYIRALKKLFLNKCNLIAAHEKITKIENIIKTTGVLNDFMMPIIFSATDFINSASPGTINSQTQAVIDTLRRLKVFSEPSQFTTWALDKDVPYVTDSGEGTGTFEITTVASLNCSSSVKFMGGSASLTIEDPYKLSIITRNDIERAISQVSSIGQNTFFKFTEVELRKTIDSLQESLKQSRTARDVSQIKFVVNENALLFKKVRAIIEQEGREINFNFDGGFLGIDSSVTFEPAELEGKNGLNQFEQELFKQIVSNIFILFGYQASTDNDIKEYNKTTEYVRQRMLTELLGRSIIQQLDSIHIYISSKTQYDKKISQGLDSNFSSSYLNKINNVLTGIESSIDDFQALFSDSGQSYLENEKNAIVGPEFPTWLWYLLRNDFTKQNAGNHVFGGVVDRISQNYSNGKYTITVSAKDNCAYLAMGQINIKPGLDTFDSALYDPLTPFKLDFDPATGFVKGEIPPLLDENIRLLNTKSVKAKSGRFLGSTVDESHFKITDAETVANKSFRRKFNNPDGFIYRWKKGIGSLTLFGEPHANNTFKKETIPSLTRDPFAGQDVMNVLSLLITGQPYNYNNFLKSALNSASLSKEDLSNNPASTSFFKSLVSDLTKNNSIWGNFVPFKKMTINSAGYNFLRSGEFDLTIANKKLQDLLNERAKRFDELSSVLPDFASNPQFYKTGLQGQNDGTVNSIDADVLAKLGKDIIELDSQIEQQKKFFQKTLDNPNLRSDTGTIKIFGDDVSFDSTVSQTSSVTPGQQFSQEEEFRKKINFLTQRRLWQVKSNQDINYFIVDDAYDKNYDIQAFEKSLAGSLETFRSTYTRASEKIEGIAQMLGLEVFADTQGHIQARPPQYNRMPSSVFYQMLQDKKMKGIQIFPKYLESLFFNQIKGLTDQVEIIEDEIRLRAAGLGYVTDDSIRKLLSSGITGIGNAGSGTNFSFVTSEDGKVGGKDLRNLLLQNSPDLLEDSSKKALTQLSSAITNAAGSTINFDIVKRVRIVNEEQTAFSVNDTVVEKINSRIDEIGKRLQDKTGKPALTKQQLLPNSKNRINSSGKSQTDLLNLTNQISQFLSERQYAIKLLTNAVKNLDTGLELDRSTDAGKNALFPELNKRKENIFPDIIKHMIEDEDFDDYGPGSGQRYVLRDVDIISMNVDETAPPFTIVEVDGALEGGLVSGPSGLEVGSGGNGISAAFAVDYDMWRQYGFKGFNAVNVPFLSDPEGQCAPYAVFLLNQARKNILTANVSIRGNEYIQPGEVYYIEDRDLLFYAESISHEFSYGQSFTSSINLSYGHAPGEFIPTMLDIIGKGLYTNRFQADLVKHIRNSPANGDSNLGAVVNNTPTYNSGSGDAKQISSNETIEYLLNGSFGTENKKTLERVMTIVSGLLSPTKSSDSLKLQLRIYFNSKQGYSSINGGVKKIAEGIKNWLVNPSKGFNNLSGSSVLPDNKNQTLIEPNNISIVEIDLGKTEEVRSPSSAAWSSARILAVNNVNFHESNDDNFDILSKKELQNLFLNIVDIWASFESPSESQGDSKVLDTDEVSQDQQKEKEKYMNNFDKYVKGLKG